MKLSLSRDSVAAGDDADAPHRVEIILPPGADTKAAVAHIVAARYLPRISGGQATWSVHANGPVAVLAQQWVRAKLLPMAASWTDIMAAADGRLGLHVAYHAQQDPELVFAVLSRITHAYFPHHDRSGRGGGP